MHYRKAAAAVTALGIVAGTQVVLATAASAGGIHHKSYPAVVRSDGTHWTFLLRGSFSGGNATNTATYGLVTDRPLQGDWDGNGSVTPGVIRDVGGHWVWLLRNTYTGGGADIASGGYGRTATDIPVTGDWDGNGSVTPGVVRNNNGRWQWLLRNDYNGGSAQIDVTYGLASDIPIVGDWDGNGSSTLGVLRRDNGGWRYLLRNSASGGVADLSFIYGKSTDKPTVGDWNGDGRDTPGVVRGNQWLLRNSNTGGANDMPAFGYGLWSDRPNVMSREPIAADPVVRADLPDGSAGTATNWMQAQVGQPKGAGLCLYYMKLAYNAAGVPFDSSYSAWTWWNEHAAFQRRDANYKPGDLVFFDYVSVSGERLGHVGIYAGVVNGQPSIIGTGALSTGGTRIGVDPISARGSRLLGYIRMVP